MGSVTVAHGSGGTARWLQSTGSAALVQGLLGGIFPDQELRQADSCPPGGSEVKASAGDLGFIPGSGRSPGEESGTPLQYSCLENPMDKGDWWAAVHGVTKSQTSLSDGATQMNESGKIVFVDI